MRADLKYNSLFTGILFAAGLTASPPAHAQETPEAESETIVVTGSRIRQRDLVANSPFETVTVQELNNSATLSVETFLNTLPQVAPNVSMASNNPSSGDGSGKANIDLRGLGPERNVILLDGRRLVGADRDNVVDVNLIPVSLIERVEIISGGASAVYGPDAVSGVVNFILRDDFEGSELDVQYLVSGMDDAQQFQAAMTIGGDFADDRGNVVFNVSYADRDQLGKGDRDFSAQADATTSYFPSGTWVDSGNQPTQAAVDAVFAGYGASAGAAPPNGGATGFGFNGDGTLYSTGVAGSPLDVVNFRRDESEIATLFFPDRFSYNFEPDNNMILPLERQSFATFAHYELTDWARLYGQGIFANYVADQALAPSPAPTGGNPLDPGAGVNFTIPTTNPFISADLRALLDSRTGDRPLLNGSGPNEDFLYRFRATSLGPRLSSNEQSIYHMLTGVELTLPADWRGDAYYSQGRYVTEETQSGNLSVRRFEALLDSPTGGTEFCPGGFNPFGVGLSEECGAFVEVIAKNRYVIEQDNAVITFNGPLPFAMPTSGQPIDVAVGAEYRSVDLNFTPDSALQPGEVAGFNGQGPIKGYIDFTDLFFEASFPLLEAAPVINDLELVVGYRLTDSNRFDQSETYKGELSWLPIDALRFRGSFQHAIRAPTIGELFAPLDENAPAVNDPCNADNPNRTAQVLALCQAQGAALGFSDAFVAGYQQPRSQIDALQGGNPNLEPEEADTFTLGVVFQPTIDAGPVQNVAMSVDYYDIAIEEAIFAADPQLTANNCYSAATNPAFDPNSPFCTTFQRSPGDFTIFNLLQLQANQGNLETSGVDLSFSFESPLDEQTGVEWLGLFRAGVNVTWVQEFLEQTSPLTPTFDYAGALSDDPGETLPEWKGSINLGWKTGPFGADLRGRYIDAMAHRADIIVAPDDDPGSSGVGAAWYWDLATRYDLSQSAQLRFGVLNLFDREIEQYANNVDAQTDPSTYDVIGRRFFIGVNLRR